MPIKKVLRDLVELRAPALKTLVACKLGTYAVSRQELSQDINEAE